MNEKTYVVYKLYFDNSDKFYIGKTSNISKRIYLHKIEAFYGKDKTPKNIWIKFNMFNEHKLKHEILFETTDEKKAYEVEKNYIIKTSDKNVNSVNNYNNPSGKSEDGLRRMAEIFGKKYILIDKTGKITEVLSLSRFGRENKLNYKDLNACAKKITNSSQGYKVFYKEDWDDFSEDEKTEEINKFKSYNQYETKAFKKSGDKYRKDYVIINPKGSIDIVTGLSSYIKNNNLNDGNMFTSLSKSKPYKGYQVFYKEVWDSFSDDIKTKYVNKSKNYIEKSQKMYEITTPDGTTEVIVGLGKYAKKNNLHAPSLSSLASGKLKTYKGYKIKIIECL